MNPDMPVVMILMAAAIIIVAYFLVHTYFAREKADKDAKDLQRGIEITYDSGVKKKITFEFSKVAVSPSLVLFLKDNKLYIAKITPFGISAPVEFKTQEKPVVIHTFKDNVYYETKSGNIYIIREAEVGTSMTGMKGTASIVIDGDKILAYRLIDNFDGAATEIEDGSLIADFTIRILK